MWRNRFDALRFLVPMALAATLASASGTFAEGKPEKAEPAPKAVEAPSNAPFMKPLERLSTVLGSIHFLRKLCGDGQADLWRDKMSDLIAAQSPGEQDKRKLIASFNSGYRAFESTYRKCTPAARIAVDRYQKEGATLAKEISARYGN